MTTQRYVDLYEEIYSDLKPTNYICEIATSAKDAKNLGIETVYQDLALVNTLNIPANIFLT